MARTVAHTVHVDRMLDSLSPDQFEEWYAMWLLEPWGDEWQQAGTVAAAVHNGLAAQYGGRFRGPDYFIPRFTTQKQRETEKNLALEQRRMAGRYSPQGAGERSEVRSQKSEAGGKRGAASC